MKDEKKTIKEVVDALGKLLVPKPTPKEKESGKR